jgi:hypothetical protein
MEFDLGCAGGVLPHKGVRLHQLHVVLLGHAHVQDALHTHTRKNISRMFYIRMFLGLLDPDPDPVVRGTDLDPDPSISKQKLYEKPKFLLFCDFFLTYH